MQLYPAIDMKDGKCVRLRQGAFQDMTVYSDTPEKVAAYWQEQGASFLHLVDLDGALAGHSVNEPVIEKIAKTVSIPIELGGGIRSRESVLQMLSLGIKRVIIGTKAVERPEFLRELGGNQQNPCSGFVYTDEGFWYSSHCLYGYFQGRNVIRAECGSNKSIDKRNRA